MIIISLGSADSFVLQLGTSVLIKQSKADCAVSGHAFTQVVLYNVAGFGATK